MRATVLWVCASLLGIAAGRSLVAWRNSKTSDNVLGAKEYGFRSQSDMDRMVHLSEERKIVALSPSDFAILARYATGQRPASTQVCEVLENAGSEAIANQCLPIAKAEITSGKNQLEMGFVVVHWAKSGYVQEAQELKTLEPKNESQ